MPIRDALLVIFLDGYVTGMTGMTKKMETRHRIIWQSQTVIPHY